MNTLFEIAGDYRFLSDAELIYNITNSQEVTKEYNELLKHNDIFSLENLLANLTPGRQKVAAAAIEIYKRTKEREITIHTITSSQDIYKLMYPLLCDLPNEEFWILLLNQANRIIKRVRLSFGGIDGTYADPRLLFKLAIMNNAVSFAVIHNHPSGQLEPSTGDKRLTQHINNAAGLLNMKLIDHIIIGDNGYYSFADSGEM